MHMIKKAWPKVVVIFIAVLGAALMYHFHFTLPDKYKILLNLSSAAIFAYFAVRIYKTKQKMTISSWFLAFLVILILATSNLNLLFN